MYYSHCNGLEKPQHDFKQKSQRLSKSVVCVVSSLPIYSTHTLSFYVHPPPSFLDEIQEQMAGVEDEAVIVKELFDLIHKYQVPTPPEDLAVYQVHRAFTQGCLMSDFVCFLD